MNSSLESWSLEKVFVLSYFIYRSKIFFFEKEILRERNLQGSLTDPRKKINILLIYTIESSIFLLINFIIFKIPFQAPI